MGQFALTGNIHTDPQGVQKLYDFYTYAKRFKDCWFNLDLENLQFIDANLSAELLLYCHLLKKNNNLKFYLDYQSLKGHLNVLSRNGLAHSVVYDKQYFKPYDEKDSVIPLKAFKMDNVDSFVHYIENIFLKQRGLEQIKQEHKDRIKSSYFEIFDNVGIHANTTIPVICCGQYFPKEGELKFTMTDYGEGFLNKIAQHTVNDFKKITKPSEAIYWAVKGGSTKTEGIKGGNGLNKIMSYCYQHGGSLNIVSDGCFWSFEHQSIKTFQLKNHRQGATIHLIFRFLS